MASTADIFAPEARFFYSTRQALTVLVLVTQNKKEHTKIKKHPSVKMLQKYKKFDCMVAINPLQKIVRDNKENGPTAILYISTYIHFK